MCYETSNGRLIESDLRVRLLEKLWKPRRPGHHGPELDANFEPAHLRVGNISQSFV